MLYVCWQRNIETMTKKAKTPRPAGARMTPEPSAMGVRVRAGAPRTSPRRQADRREATRTALLTAARRLFIEKGFGATATPEIVEAAGMTRGALYHHFADKAELFKAVAMAMANEVASAIALPTPRRSASPPSPFDALRAGARAYFAAMADAGRARVLLIEAPNVLSQTDLLALSDASGATQLEDGLRAALGASAHSAPRLRALADLLSAAFDRAAWRIANGEAAARYLDGVSLLMDGLEAMSTTTRSARRGQERAP